MRKLIIAISICQDLMEVIAHSDKFTATDIEDLNDRVNATCIEFNAVSCFEIFENFMVPEDIARHIDANPEIDIATFADAMFANVLEIYKGA